MTCDNIKYKSEVNFSILGIDILVSIFITIFVISILGPYIYVLLWVKILIGLIVFYVISMFSDTFYISYFYDQKLVSVHCTRLFYRKKTILYKDISKIVYKNKLGKGEFPKFRIYREGCFGFKKYKTFVFNSFEKRKEIIYFLHSKKIPIIINTNFTKDENIKFDLNL